MARNLRFVSEPKTLIEVTDRTIHGRYLLLPTPQLKLIILGALGRAQRLHGVRIFGFACLSNHFHLLAEVDDAEQLSRFMNCFLSKLAREVGRLYNWKEKVFPRRYQSIPVTGEDRAQIDRLKYLLAHSVKEGLVERLEEWPGAHCVHSLLTGEPLEGIWHERKQETRARNRGKKVEPGQFETRETVTFDPLPCWQHLAPQEQRRRVARLVEEIEAEGAAERKRTGKPVLGVAAILAQDPHDHPERPKKSPAPFVHAATKAARLAFREAYALFVAAYREAAAKLRKGDRTAVFPLGSFPPALPFVGG
jgi:REP element-mobilizing transposase RayT